MSYPTFHRFVLAFVSSLLLAVAAIAAVGCADSSSHKKSGDKAPAIESTDRATAEAEETPSATADKPPSENPEKDESDSEAVSGTTDKFPGIHIDLKQKYIDLEATVIRPTEEWLELLACTPGTKDHETIMTVTAQPSHIHIGLMLLKLKPGKPRRVFYDEEQEKWLVEDAVGSKVAITIVMDKDGKTVEIPANEWVINRETGKVLEGNEWIFAGSRLWKDERDPQSKPIYLADMEGTAISLVHFGNDLLVRDNDLEGGQGGGNAFNLNVKAVPKAGTKVKIRLRPVEEKNDAEKNESPTDAAPK